MGLVKTIIYKIANRSFLKLLKPQNIYPYYHIISDSNVTHIKHLYPFKNIKQFRSDLNLLIDNYKPLDPKKVFKKDSKKPIGKNYFLLTFDDGLAEVYHIIYPILLEKNIKAIFFINPNFIDNNDCLYKHKISIIIDLINNNSNKIELSTISKIIDSKFESKDLLIDSIKKINIKNSGLLNDILEKFNININDYLKDKRPYLSMTQIQEMMDNGFLFGGHTMSHPRLLELSHQDQKSEIINSIEWLKSNFGIDYSLFAFPFTDKGVSKYIIDEIFSYDPNTVIFGNSGIRKDVDDRIIHRFSLEDPSKKVEKQIVTENIYKYYNKVIGKYKISRK